MNWEAKKRSVLLVALVLCFGGLPLCAQNSGETKTDLAQARLAIDVLAALVQLTEGRFDPHEVRDLHNLLSSLQLNYVQRAAK